MGGVWVLLRQRERKDHRRTLDRVIVLEVRKSRFFQYPRSSVVVAVVSQCFLVYPEPSPVPPTHRIPYPHNVAFHSVLTEIVSVAFFKIFQF